MSMSEFKAWLEGYEASFTEAPSPEQWQAIKAKLATVGDSHGGRPADPWLLPNQLIPLPQNIPGNWWANPVIGSAMGDIADARAVHRNVGIG